MLKPLQVTPTLIRDAHEVALQQRLSSILIHEDEVMRELSSEARERDVHLVPLRSCAKFEMILRGKQTDSLDTGLLILAIDFRIGGNSEELCVVRHALGRAIGSLTKYRARYTRH